MIWCSAGRCRFLCVVTCCTPVISRKKAGTGGGQAGFLELRLLARRRTQVHGGERQNDERREEEASVRLIAVGQGPVVFGVVNRSRVAHEVRQDRAGRGQTEQRERPTRMSRPPPARRRHDAQGRPSRNTRIVSGVEKNAKPMTCRPSVYWPPMDVHAAIATYVIKPVRTTCTGSSAHPRAVGFEVPHCAAAGAAG